jgi:hypothetical protein
MFVGIPVGIRERMIPAYADFDVAIACEHAADFPAVLS